jgi:hypothetical protein
MKNMIASVHNDDGNGGGDYAKTTNKYKEENTEEEIK